MLLIISYAGCVMGLNLYFLFGRWKFLNLKPQIVELVYIVLVHGRLVYTLSIISENIFFRNVNYIHLSRAERKLFDGESVL